MLSVGDATIDHFFFIHDASVQCDVNKEDCKLVINYADKLAVDKFLRVTASNAMNQAISSSLLGLKTAFYTVIGEDSAGKGILEQLKKYGVSDDCVQIDKENSTNVSAVISFNGERTILVYHVERKYNFRAREKRFQCFQSKMHLMRSRIKRQFDRRIVMQIFQYLFMQ